MAEYRWDPATFGAVMGEQVPDYDELQERLAEATRGRRVATVLDLGTGTGETARRVLALHPGAHLVGVDASAAMLDEARRTLPGPVELHVARLEDPLPPGPFDLVVSALAVHHLDAAAKADLFARIAAETAPGGRFVLGDVVVPGDPDRPAEPAPDSYDKPDRVADQLGWLAAAGFDAAAVWRRGDLALIVADAR